MGRILVLYHSEKGGTARMAECVGEGAATVDGMEVRRRSIEQASKDDLLWCDGIALGAPTHLGGIPWAMKKWWDTEAIDVWMDVDGKIGCVFSSSGGWGGGTELACQALATLLMNFGMLVFGITDYVAPGFTLHYGAITAGGPREPREAAACRRLGRRLAEFVAAYVDGRKDLLPTRADYPRMPPRQPEPPETADR